MPWRATDLMDERAKFVHRLEAGERMSDLCREFEISRKTGYKVLKRYQEEGLEGLINRSRRPSRSPNRTPQHLVDLIVDLRRKRPTWGPKKLRWKLEQCFPGVKLPAQSTIAVVLKREGLVKGRKRRHRATPTPGPLTDAKVPNQVWAMDFKGQFRLGNGRYCYPLTVTDQFSRYLLWCEAQENTRGEPVIRSFGRLFETYGLPKTIRSDNGSPFASTGRCGLSPLGVWLLRLGIKLERIQPSHPEQNGRHERMHRTLKAETTRPARKTFLAQQERFDDFRQDFNTQRPHEAIGMKPPATVYAKSEVLYTPYLAPLLYPLHDCACRVKQNGCVFFGPLNTSIYIGTAFRGEQIGFRELDDGCWLVQFMDIELGYLDKTTKTLLTTKNLAS